MIITTLAASQHEFMEHLLDDERAMPKDWTQRQAKGIAVYRNAYRTRLVDALRDTYERTAKWIGDDSFRQAAAHHVITHPPTSWTLDAAGDSFPDTLRELFANDTEVAELAWLEWAMHRSFVAKDAEPMSVEEFGTAGSSFQEDDWANLRLVFLPGTYQRPITHNIGELWRALAEDVTDDLDYAIDAPLFCVVWREGLKPAYRQTDAAEGQAMSMMLGGASYGETCEALVEELGETQAVAQAGEMLGRWLHQGLIAAAYVP